MLSLFESPVATPNAEVVQPTSGLQDGIGVTLFGVAEGVFDDASPFHPGQPVLHFDPNPGQLSIGPLRHGRQVFPAHLFSAGKFP